MQIPNKWLSTALGILILGPVCFSQGSKGGSGSSQGGAQQSSSPSPGSNSPGGTPSANQGGGSGGGFSIEGEILAYKALQSDSEAISCDIAGFLFAPQTTGFSPNGPSATAVNSACVSSGSPAGRIAGGNLTKGVVADSVVQGGKLEGTTLSGATLTGATIKEATVMEVASSTNPLPKGVIVLSSSGTTMSNFQVWRMDMAIMTQLEVKAADFGCPSKDVEKTLSVAGLDIAQQAVALVQGALGLFASNESVTGVAGTIQDQALVNAVARQLRGLNISVLMPDTYGPFTFSGIDYQSSPFFQNFAVLVRCRICLQAYLKNPANQVSQQELDADTAALKSNFDKQKADQKDVDQGKLSNKELEAKLAEIADLKQKAEDLNKSIKDKSQRQGRMNDAAGLLASIDSFISSLTGGGSSASAPGSDTTKTQSQTGTPSAPSSPSSSPPPIAAVLAADGLAREIGMKADGTSGDGSIWQHVLLLKALESGGSLITHSNIFGSKTFFSGGAAATYALFTLNGRLSCSGNVYDYGGYIRAKDFSNTFRNPDIDPRKHLVLLRGGCASPDEGSGGLTQK